MGTNNAFGGSNAAAWKRVREEWTGLDGDPNDPSDVTDQGGDTSGATDPSAEQQATGQDAIYDSLLAAIAGALIGDDPDARRPSVPVVPLSSVLPSRGGSGGTGAGGVAGGGGMSGGSVSGSRRVTGQAARGGSAIGAAAAYRDRDANALASYGLTLEELDALSPRMRCARILDMAVGPAGHPDEQAMRQASIEQVKALVAGGQESASISGLEALRSFIGELTVRLALVELRDQILAKTVSAKQAIQREKGLRQWVNAKVRRLNLGRYGHVSPSEFHQVARQMSVDALRLLKGR